jgi:hypothetical protein
MRAPPPFRNVRGGLLWRRRLHKIYIDEVMKTKKQNADEEPGTGGGSRRTWRAFEMDSAGRIIEIIASDNLSAAQRQRDTQTSRLEALKKRNL